MDETFDVVVVGAGAAGLSGAVALARSRRSVLVVDAGEPRNAPAGHVHNFLTRDGTPPAEIYAAGRGELSMYGGRLETGRVERVRRDGDGFVLDLGGRTVGARRVLVATGLRDELPEVPGLAGRWGVDVLHCPYCHGWEVRDRRIGVLATGPMTVHQALLFRQLSAEVTVVLHGATLSDDDREQLDARAIRVVDGPVAAVEAGLEGMSGVRLAGGDTVALDALAIAPRAVANAELLRPLGLEPVELLVGEHVIGTRIDADETGATAVPGVWVAGNVADMRAMVVVSAGAGLAAGAAINADLVAEDTRRAVEALRFERTYGESAWDERYRSRPQAWSGRPNPVLVSEVSDLTPGSVLDAGAGEGADACWLAEHGWKVTAADLSTVALERAAAEADRRGLSVTWVHQDLSEQPADDTYDLVSAQYLHLPPDRRGRLFAHLAAAVAPGGTLLVVGHDLRDLETTLRRPDLAVLGWAAEEVADSLGGGWTVEVVAARPRSVDDPDGNPVTVHDAVLRARRDRA